MNNYAQPISAQAITDQQIRQTIGDLLVQNMMMSNQLTVDRETISQLQSELQQLRDELAGSQELDNTLGNSCMVSQDSDPDNETVQPQIHQSSYRSTLDCYMSGQIEHNVWIGILDDNPGFKAWLKEGGYVGAVS